MSQPETLSQRILRTLWRHAPVSASYLGIHDYDHLFASYETGAVEERAAELREHLREIRARREGGDLLDPAEELDLDLLEGELETQLRFQGYLRFPFRNPASYLEDATFGVYILMLRDYAPLEDRAQQAVMRLAAVPRLLREARANLSDPSEVPPLWASVGIDLCRSASEFFGEMWDQVKRSAPALEAEFGQATASARAAVEEYGRFISEEIHPRARGDFAAGRETLDFFLRVQHGLTYSAAEIEEFGGSEIQKTRKLLEAEAGRNGSKRSWIEVVEECAKEVAPPAGLVSHYQAEITRARRFLLERDLVSIPAGESLRVVETPVFERKTTPFAAYIPPAPFETRQEGLFWVTPPDPPSPGGAGKPPSQAHLLAGIPITSVHEGYPGHHLQISLANRLPSWVQRQVWSSVMVEGWALYCEEMMGEQGFYADPRTRILQLKDHLWRACRIVIDVGLHTGKLRFEDAVTMLVEVARLDPSGAEGEVKRYSKTPTQPLSYAVGKREILKLREEVASREGGSFSLRDFHDRLLRCGSMPFALIRKRFESLSQE